MRELERELGESVRGGLDASGVGVAAHLELEGDLLGLEGNGLAFGNVAVNDAGHAERGG